MSRKSHIRDLLKLTPLTFSGVVGIFLFLQIRQMSLDRPDTSYQIEAQAPLIIGISAGLAALLMVYLALAAVFHKNTRQQAIETLSGFTQKMHYFREIIGLMVRSKIWVPGLKDYIEEEFEGLTFFEVKEFYKGSSQQAIEFLQEHHQYNDTENLYLEFKSLLLTHPSERLNLEQIKYPDVYGRAIVEKWLAHKCGSGLWYYFGYKYGDFKASLDYNAVFERHQDKIMNLALSIDHEAFQDSSFNDVFLAKLGEYMNQEVVPKLMQFKGQTESHLPPIMNYLYVVFALLIGFGVFIPLVSLILQWSPVFLILGISVTLSVLLYIALGFYPYIYKEANSK